MAADTKLETVRQTNYRTALTICLKNKIDICMYF